VLGVLLSARWAASSALDSARRLGVLRIGLSGLFGVSVQTALSTSPMSTSFDAMAPRSRVHPLKAHPAPASYLMTALVAALGLLPVALPRAWAPILSGRSRWSSSAGCSPAC